MSNKLWPPAGFGLSPDLEVAGRGPESTEFMLVDAVLAALHNGDKAAAISAGENLQVLLDAKAHPELITPTFVHAEWHQDAEGNWQHAAV